MAGGTSVPPGHGEIRVPIDIVFDIPFANITHDDLVAQIDHRIASREPGFIATPNVDHVCRLPRDPAFKEAYARAWLRVVDSTILRWAARLSGVRLKEKLSGSDLVYSISAHAARKGHRVFYFGARPGVAEKAAEQLQARYPGLVVAGTYCPPLFFEQAPETHEAAVKAVQEARADIIFVALGCPRQEIWLAEVVEQLGVPVAIGVGASLDFASGRMRRAPVWMQKCGMEWIWRLCLEPRRMWRRYLVQDSAFLPIAIREIVRGRSRS